MNEPPAILPDVFWVTRDTLGGVLSSKCEVWAVRPHLESCEDGDALWFASLDLLDGDDLTCLGEWSVAQCKLQIGTYPEGKLECIRVGRDLPVEFTSRTAPVVH
jgi:hypothetical protein